MSCDENVSNNLRKELSIVERQLKECDDLIIKSQGEGDESKKSVMISEAVTCMEDIKGPVNKLSTAARYVASVCDNVKLHDSLTKKGTKNTHSFSGQRTLQSLWNLKIFVNVAGISAGITLPVSSSIFTCGSILLIM